jgi:hypothetical protein
LKIDRYIKDLYRRVNDLSNGNNDGNGNNHHNDDTFRIDEYDDECYLDQNRDPPRFAYYRHVRWEKLDERKQRILNGYDIDLTITQDELDFILRRQIRMPPEQRYQREKAHWYWHESSWTWRGLDATGYDGEGCNQFTGCIPECRYYPKYGRIEDDEVIEKHKELVERHKQENSIVEPPSESELLRIAEKYHFH